MLRPNIDIRIKNDQDKVLFFDYCHLVEVESSWKDLTNRATIVLPRKIKALGTDKVNELIQAGNEVVIRAGYDGELVDEFKGYVTSVSSKIPVTIECEDLMWKLKQTSITKTLKSVTLSNLLADILPADVPYQASSQTVGKVRYSKMSVAKILDDLKKKQGIVSYVRMGKLYVGEAYPVAWRSDPNYTVNYAFTHNIISNDLTFKHKKDVKVKVKAISRHSNGKDVTVIYPSDDSDRELHTYHAHNGLNKTELKKIAERNYDKFVYDGFRGGIKVFGAPYCDHGYVADITDTEYPERSGKYLIDKVVMYFGVNGYKRELTLGGKA